MRILGLYLFYWEGSTVCSHITSVSASAPCRGVPSLTSVAFAESQHLLLKRYVDAVVGDADGLNDRVSLEQINTPDKVHGPGFYCWAHVLRWEICKLTGRGPGAQILGDELLRQPTLISMLDVIVSMHFAKNSTLSRVKLTSHLPNFESCKIYSILTWSNSNQKTKTNILHKRI